jgi:tetratricopeptide (TPR) repeat protein
MVYYQQEDEEARLRRQLSGKAVELACQGRWEEAEAINKSIIEKFSSDVEAYNRLGKALTELGDFAQAKEAYLKALALAPENAIAKKNLARLASLSESITTLGGKHTDFLPFRVRARKVAPEFFTTEMGKSGVVNLCNLASGEVLAKVGLGDEVQLSVKGQRLTVESAHGEYLGEVEPKHALRLVKLIKGGNGYAAAILSLGENEVQVLIREVYQDPSQMGRLSFPVQATERLRSYLEESFLRRKIAIDEAGVEESGSPEEEAEYSRAGEEPLPEGFTVVGETGDEGELGV